MNELANEELKKLGVFWMNPYRFHEDSCFVSGLILDNDENLRVESHSHPKQAFVLMRLFDKWIYYSDVLIED